MYQDDCGFVAHGSTPLSVRLPACVHIRASAAGGWLRAVYTWLGTDASIALTRAWQPW